MKLNLKNVWKQTKIALFSPETGLFIFAAMVPVTVFSALQTKDFSWFFETCTSLWCCWIFMSRIRDERFCNEYIIKQLTTINKQEKL